MENSIKESLKMLSTHLGKYREYLIFFWNFQLTFIYRLRFFPKKVDLQAIHKYYDTDQDGTISYNEFLNALCDDKLSERKQKMFVKLWACLDKDCVGQCKGTDILDMIKDESKGMVLLE